MGKLCLVVPNLTYTAQILAYKQAFLDRGEALHGTAGLSRAESVEGWLLDLAQNEKEETVQSGLVPASTFLGVRARDNCLVGMIDIRHRLNDYLQKAGGHIGYCVHPDHRQKGYATQMLHLALVKCGEMGIPQVLVCCDKENIASAKTILANGGVLENEVWDKEDLVQRYWILPPQKKTP